MAKKNRSNWEAGLAKEASKERAREKAGTGGLGNRLSIKGRRFTFDGENLGRTLRCVVADFVYFNTYYKGKYKEDAVNIPVCFALSEDGENMKPHENSTKRQHKNCEGCEWHKWGSGRGRARACQERRRMAIIHEDDLDDIENASVAFLELPVTSVKNWSKFLKECDEKLSRPFYSVIAELSFDEDQEWPVVVFSVEEKIKDKETVEAIQELRDDIRDDLMTPFDAAGDDDKDDEDDDDDDEDDDDKKPRRGKKPNKRKSRSKDDDDEDEEDADDDDDEDDEDDDEDDEEDAPRKKGKKTSRRSTSKRRASEDDDDDDDDDDEDEDDDDDAPRSRRGRSASKGKGKARADEDDDDDEDDEDEDEDERPKKRKRSRFGR